MAGRSLLLLSCAAALTHAELLYEQDVAVLDPDNFDGFIQSQDYTLVEFYAPWCGHCKSLAPEWAAAAAGTKQLKPAVILAKVDADAHRSLAERFDISGYPTIKIFKKGVAEDYNGPRESKGIVSFVKSALGITASSVSRVRTAEQFQEFLDDNGYLLLGLFREPVTASGMFNVFAEVASDISMYVDKPIKALYAASYASSKEPITESLGAKQPAVLLFRPGKEVASIQVPRKRDEFTESYLANWLQAQLK